MRPYQPGKRAESKADISHAPTTSEPVGLAAGRRVLAPLGKVRILDGLPLPHRVVGVNPPSGVDFPLSMCYGGLAAKHDELCHMRRNTKCLKAGYHLWRPVAGRLKVCTRCGDAKSLLPPLAVAGGVQRLVMPAQRGPGGLS